MSEPQQLGLWGEPEPLRDPHDDREAPAHRDGPDTEHIAAALVRPRAGLLRARALDAFAGAPDGLTDPELADLTGVYLYSIAPRRCELTRDGWLVDTGARRTTDRGRPAVVWGMSDRGRAQYDNPTDGGTP